MQLEFSDDMVILAQKRNIMLSSVTKTQNSVPYTSIQLGVSTRWFARTPFQIA